MRLIRSLIDQLRALHEWRKRWASREKALRALRTSLIAYDDTYEHAGTHLGYQYSLPFAQSSAHPGTDVPRHPRALASALQDFVLAEIASREKATALATRLRSENEDAVPFDPNGSNPSAPEQSICHEHRFIYGAVEELPMLSGRSAHATRFAWDCIDVGLDEEAMAIIEELAAHDYDERGKVPPSGATYLWKRDKAIEKWKRSARALHLSPEQREGARKANRRT